MSKNWLMIWSVFGGSSPVYSGFVSSTASLARLERGHLVAARSDHLGAVLQLVGREDVGGDTANDAVATTCAHVASGSLRVKTTVLSSGALMLFMFASSEEAPFGSAISIRCTP